MSKNWLIILALLMLAGGGYAWREYTHEHEDKASAAHEHAEGDERGHSDKDEHEEGHGDEGHIKMAAEIAAVSGIIVEEVKPATIRESITLSGRVILNQNTTAQVKARFPGVVREVRKGTGEVVAKGDVLAMVESNDSLQIYPVTSPVSGTVLKKNTNMGDVAESEPIFVVADLSKLWAEFHVFSRDMARVQIGQTIHVKNVDGGLKAESKITAILPIAEESSQTVVVRSALDNPENQWRAGMVVHGDAVTTEREVQLAVKTSALQRMGDNTVVFVQEGEGFEARPLKLGMRDDEYVEVLEGLKAGERYAANNSFLLKAELGKSEAEHEH